MADKPSFNSVTNEINYESKTLSKFANGKCGEFFRASLDCYVSSSSTVKGLNCADNFNELITCCLQNPKHCPEEFKNAEPVGE